MTNTPEPLGMPLLRANLVWDLLTNKDVATKMLKLLDMTPPGPDGVAMAIEDSQIRAAMVKPLTNPIEVLSSEISTIYIRAILGEAAKELDEELVADLTSTYVDFLRAGLKVAIANMMAAGILTYDLRTS